MDLLNHDTWRPVADLIDDWKTIVAGLGVLGAAALAVMWWGTQPVRWLIARFRRAPSLADAKDDRPLRFVAHDPQMFCGAAGARERTGTHVHGGWHVTNVSDRSIYLLKARLDEQRAEFVHIAINPSRGRAFGSPPIPAGRTARVDVDMGFTPAIHAAKNDLVADVVFTDNHGDEHRVPSVRFRCVGP